MVADVVRNVGGPLVQIEQLMGPGVDPHVYKPSTRDIVALDRADCIFYSGLHLEGKLAEILASMATRQTTVALAEGLAAVRLLEPAPGQHDPHVWFDVALWNETVPTVLNALTKLAPDHASHFAERAEAYQRRLTQLDAFCREQLGSIPEQRRVLVTAHDAFHYFGRAYHVEVRAIQGVSTESEAGVRDINQLVSFLVERKIKAVFVESSVSPRNVEALVEGCRSHGHEIRVGGELYSDAMGPADSDAATYEGMVRHNVQTIVGALK